jgi:cobalt-zinc-cadmium efflux system protein
LERTPRGIDPEAVTLTLRADPTVKDIIGLHIWGLDDGDVIASVVAVTTEDSVAAAAAAAARIKAALRARHGIAHATIEWQLAGSAEPCCE